MRNVIGAFADEYRRHRNYAESAFEQVTEQQYLQVVGDASIAMYVQHLGGNLRSRFTDFLISDGEKADRDRDSEFELGGTRRGSLELWSIGWQTLEGALSGLRDSDLETLVKIRGQELTVASALARSLAHTSYHVGQIVLLAKIYAGANWRSLSIPRGQSKQYNQNPTLERPK